MLARYLYLAVALGTGVAATSVKFSSKPNPNYKVLAASGGDDVDLNSSRDLIYISSISVSGQNYNVQLDTGSSDLWIYTSGGVPNTQSTGLTYNLSYGIGFAYGNIVTTQVEFAGFTIQKQAFVDAQSASNPVLQLGAVGILGLGFTSLSAVDVTVGGAAYGHSFLYNVFAQDPSVPNFISFLLSRNNDPQAPQEGQFTISEYDPQYSAVQGAVQVSTFPETNPNRWTVLMDGYAISGNRMSVSTTVSGVPGGNTVVLLDSGTTFTYAPESVVTAIFSNLPGANFDDSLSQWTLPCDTEVDVSLFFAGQQYDIHPLDMVVPGATDPSVCVGSFIPQSLAVAQGQFDWLIGVNTLRSFYTVYDFGDPVSSSNAQPFVRLLQLMSASAASADFHAVRGGTPASASASASASSGSASGSSAGASGTSSDTSSGPHGIIASPTGSDGPSPTESSGNGGGNGNGDGSSSGSSGNGGDSSGEDNGTPEQDTTGTGSILDSITMMATAAPAVLGVLGIQAIVLVTLLGAAVLFLFCWRKRGRGTPTPGTLQLGQGAAYARVAGADMDIERQGSLRSMRSARGPAGVPLLAAQAIPPRGDSLLTAPAPRYDSSTLPGPPRIPSHMGVRPSSSAY